MESKREIFVNYLKTKNIYLPTNEAVYENFYHAIIEANSKINLFSRKMDIDEIWTKHFLDSVSIFSVYSDFSKKNVLDFGTGGGFPGLPIKIICPDMKLTLLDSTKKKIEILRQLVELIKIDNVNFLDHRIEDKAMSEYKGYFDIIVCRAVKIDNKLLYSLLNVLKNSGKMFLYMSKRQPVLFRSPDFLKIEEHEIEETGTKIIVGKKIWVK